MISSTRYSGTDRWGGRCLDVQHGVPVLEASELDSLPHGEQVRCGGEAVLVGHGGEVSSAHRVHTCEEDPHDEHPNVANVERGVHGSGSGSSAGGGRKGTDAGSALELISSTLKDG